MPVAKTTHPNPDSAPLTEEHYVAIKESLAAIAVAEKQLAKAKLAGFDLVEQEKALKDYKEKFTRIKSIYFPTR